MLYTTPNSFPSNLRVSFRESWNDDYQAASNSIPQIESNVENVISQLLNTFFTGC